jgi:DNA polymerase V
MFTICSDACNPRNPLEPTMLIAVAAPCPLFLPIMRRAVRAGFPSPADDHAEGEIDLTRLLISNRPATFLVRVEGNSMTGARMFDGDIAVVDRSLSPLPGDIVVVDVDGERSFKVWGGRSGGVRLSFANPAYPAFALREDAEVEVWGVVTSTIGLGRRCDVLLRQKR